MSVDWPEGLTIDSSGQLYIAEVHGGRVLVLNTTTGKIRAIMRATPESAKLGLGHPQFVAISPKDDLWVMDAVGGTVGIINMRTGAIGKVLRENSRREAFFNRPQGIVISAKDEIYFTEWVPGTSPPDSPAHGVFHFDPTLERLSRIIGPNGPTKVTPNLSFPRGLALSSSGKLYVADGGNNRIVECDLSGKQTKTLASNIKGLTSLALDNANTLYFTEATPWVRAIDLKTESIRVIAGSRSRGFSGDGGPATAAQMIAPFGLAVDQKGNLFVSDFWDNRIRKVDARTGIIYTVAGNGTPVRSDIEKLPRL